MAKKAVIFNQWTKASASSPYVGLGVVRNANLFDYPGVVRIGRKLSKVSSTTITATLLWIDIDPATGYSYAGSDDGNVYSNRSGSWAVIAGNSGSALGGGIWKGYLITVGTTGLDACGPLSSGVSWNNNFTSVNIGGNVGVIPMFSSIDDKFYIAGGHTVDSLVELSTFNPTSSGTFTHNVAVINVGTKFGVSGIDELGSNLMLAKRPTGGLINIAEISPYSRSSYTLGIPITIRGEYGVGAMKTHGLLTYFVCKSGRIYETNGSSFSQIGRVPPYAISTINNIYPNAIDIVDGKLVFGISSAGAQGNAGIWSYNFLYKTVQLENIISTGNDGSVNILLLTAIKADSVNTFLAGWRDNASYGIDGMDGTLYTSYGCSVESDLRTVGDPINNANFENLIVQLGRKLVSGHGVRISYRKNLTDSFTVLLTFDFATYGATKNLISLAPKGNISGAEFLQIKAELTTGFSSTSTPELKNIILV